MGRSFAEIEEGVWREEYKGKHIVRLLSHACVGKYKINYKVVPLD